MTFEEFQATGYDCADIGAEISDEMLEGLSGRIYLKSLYIGRWEDDRFGVAPPNGPTWMLTLERCDWVSDDLESLERRLWDWAQAAGYND